MSSSGTIEAAKISPRFDDTRDILYWYEGDSFSIEWYLQLIEDDTGEAHPYQSGDLLYVSFFDAKKQLVHRFTFTEIENNTIITTFTPAISKKFAAGTYTYCIKYEWLDDDNVKRIQTIIDNKRARVEACH